VRRALPVWSQRTPKREDRFLIDTIDIPTGSSLWRSTVSRVRD
jgi:hypothetical protein